MSFVGNLIWFILGGGWLLGTLWIVLGLLFCVTVVGLPFGVACFRISSFAYFPFGKDLVDAELVCEKRILGTGLLNFIWCFFFGWWLALIHACLGIVECITIIGIPYGLASFKLCKAYFAPLGKRVVSIDVANEARRRAAKKFFEKK